MLTNTTTTITKTTTIEDIKARLVEELVRHIDPADILKKDGLFAQLKKQIIEKILQSELDHELGYGKHSKVAKDSDNRRNGCYGKTIIDQHGNKLEIEVPRDRIGEYEPRFIPKGLRRFNGFDEQVISLYGRGMTTREIQGHLEDLYQTEVSADLISTITDGILEEVTRWQNRPLEAVYPIMYLDCIFVKARDGTVINKAVYLAIGVNEEGNKDLLGIWMHKSEGAKFWMQVVTELKTRGVQKIYVACVDGLNGFQEAINCVFPETIVQLCIVHMIRNSIQYVSYKNLKEVTTDLKKIYTAPTEEAGRFELELFAEKWNKQYPVIANIWRNHWDGISPFFAFPNEIRRVIYTTNTIEAANRQIRKIIKNKGVFPDDKSIHKIVYLAIKNASKKWTKPIKDWALALNQFEILCGNSQGEKGKEKNYNLHKQND